MSRQIQIRRGSAAENDAFTGAIGEVTMDTTNKTLRVHDGTTAGGTKLAKQSDTTTALDDKLNKNLDNLPNISKQSLIHMCMPDFSRAYSVPKGDINNQNTATTDGYLVFRGVAANTDKLLIIDGLIIAYAYSSQFGCMVPIAKDSKYYLIGPSETYFYFVPTIGS